MVLSLAVRHCVALCYIVLCLLHCVVFATLCCVCCVSVCFTAELSCMGAFRFAVPCRCTISLFGAVLSLLLWQAAWRRMSSGWMLSCTQDSSTVIHQSAPRTDMVFDGQYYAAVDRAYFGHSIVLLSVSCAIISCSVLFSTAVQSCVVHLCAGLCWSVLCLSGLVWSGLCCSGLCWSVLCWSGLVWSYCLLVLCGCVLFWGLRCQLWSESSGVFII